MTFTTGPGLSPFVSRCRLSFERVSEKPAQPYNRTSVVILFPSHDQPHSSISNYGEARIEEERLPGVGADIGEPVVRVQVEIRFK